MTKQNRITLTSIKYAAFASEETHCFEATVLFDGQPACTVKNDGHGGADYVYPITKGKRGSTTYDTAADARHLEMEAYIATLPEEMVDVGGGETFTTKPSLETICSELVTDWLIERDMDRLLKRKIVYSKDNVLFETTKAGNAATPDELKVKAFEAFIRGKYPTADIRILNAMPRDEALQLFKGVR